MNTAIFAGCAPAPTEHTLSNAWAEYLAQRDALDRVPDQATNEAQTAAQAPFWARCDDAERTILDTPATTPAGLAIKLRLALLHSLTPRDQEEALRRDDLDHLESVELDWSDRLVLSALRSLEAMQAEAKAFASAWLTLWQAAGGWVSFDASGKLWLGQVEAFDAPGYVEPAADMPLAVRNAQTEYQMARHDGRVSALSDILKAVPGSKAALQQLVAEAAVPVPERVPTADEWLASWEAKGGGWTVIGGAPVLCCPVKGAEPGVRISDAMAELDRLGLREAVLEAIGARVAPLAAEG